MTDNGTAAAAAAVTDEVIDVAESEPVSASPSSVQPAVDEQPPPKTADTTPPVQTTTTATSIPSMMTTSVTSLSSSAHSKLATGTHFLNAVHSLLDGINDKDETVRRAIEAALGRTVEKRPNEALMALCDYRIARPKMPESQVALLMRVIEQFTAAHAARIHIDPLHRLIAFTIAEITRSADHADAVQRPGVETLVAIGRLHCDHVMDALCAQLHHSPASGSANYQPAAAHFMVLHSMGALATANQSGIVQHLKPTLVAVLPTLSTIRADHVRQAYATAVGRFAEAIAECSAADASADDGQKSQSVTAAAPPLFFDTEMAIAYDVFINQWLPCRDPKISGCILQALAHMYGLLPTVSIDEQATRVVSQLLGFYRRSMDRNAITQLLAAVLKVTLAQNSQALDTLFDPLCVHLFDLVCVNPDYERPQTVKGHYEVLRCFDCLFAVQAGRVSDMLLVQLRSNNERERIKSLLVLTHLCNQYEPFVRARLPEYTALVRPMLVGERTHKMRLVLLKLVLAFAQNGLLEDGECVRFLLRNSCGGGSAGGGSAEAVNSGADGQLADLQAELQQTCRNSLYILVTSVPSIDELMKVELLRAFVRLDHTAAAGTIAKCLGKLFARRAEMPAAAVTNEPGEQQQPDAAADAIVSTNPETIFVRCLCLLGNVTEPRRAEHILQFLKHFCPVLNRHLRQLWLLSIPELQATVDGQPAEFPARLLAFVQATIRDVDDFKFAEFLVLKLVQQQPLYPHQPLAGDAPGAGQPAGEWSGLPLPAERGMLLKLIGTCVAYVTDGPMIDAMIELILSGARQERFDNKTSTAADWQLRYADSTAALGFVARSHLTKVLQALQAMLQADAVGHRRSTSSAFFSALPFLKDSGREVDSSRMHLLAIDSYRNIARMAPAEQLLPIADTQIVPFLSKQLEAGAANNASGKQDVTMTRSVLQTLRLLADAMLAQPLAGEAPAHRLTAAHALLQLLIKLDVSGAWLSLFPLVLQLATVLLQLQLRNDDCVEAGEDAERAATADRPNMYAMFEVFARRFFVVAQQLRGKFETVEEDVRNSFLAKHLNEALPELNLLVRVLLERAASPAALDEVNGVLEHWMRDANSEVRICAGHMLNHALGVFMRTVRIGGEAPAKFNQCGGMLAAIVPRCVDVNATVRQTAVDVLQKVLEIACVYESLTIASEEMEWVRDLQRMHEDIVTDDSKDIYRITGEIARIIALRLSHFQYLQFCKSLLYTLNDVEQCSAIGSSLVLRFFVQIKGGEMFHAIGELVRDALHALITCKCSRARSGVLKALVALTKHHPLALCNEVMLCQPLPYDVNVRDFWLTLAAVDGALSGTILDNFLATLSASCLYETNSDSPVRTTIVRATLQPFAIHCTLHELLGCKEIRPELHARFPELFAMLLTTLATYTNLGAPLPPKSAADAVVQTSRSKFGFGSSSTNGAGTAAATRLNPCQVVLQSFQKLLANLEMEQLHAVLAVCPQLAEASDLTRFVELLAPMAVGLVGQLGNESRPLSQTVQALSRSVSSPYEAQRIAAVGLYAQLVPLRRPADGMATGSGGSDVTAIIMLHLNAGLTDPNALVRGLCIRGLAHVASLGATDVTKYAEISLAALLKGVDDATPDCSINVPLESMLGLSRLLNALPRDRLANFQVSLAIRLRPFFENVAADIREAAILLFGDLCRAKAEETVDSMMQSHRKQQTGGGGNGGGGDNDDDDTEHMSEALREQLLANFMTVLLHLSEPDAQIVRACKVTLRRVCTLLQAPRVNAMVQDHLLDHGQLQYDAFVVDLLKLVGVELNDSIPDFIESALPFLKSGWPQLRGNAAVVCGLLHHLYLGGGHATEAVSQRVQALLRDDQVAVRVKAAQGLGYMFGDV